MARNKHIRPAHINSIVNTIYTWDRGRLTWDDVCDAASRVLGYRPTRSGLSSHVEVQAAFSAHKKKQRTRPAAGVPSPGSLADASRRIAARDSEITTLKEQVTAYRDKFDRWRYNAMLLDITIDKLDKELPPIKRKS